MVPATEDHQMSTIYRALRFWFESQVSSQLESLNTRRELIQLVIKVESTRIFNSSSFPSSERNREKTNEKRENNSRSHTKKRNRDNVINSRKSSNDFLSSFYFQKDDPVIRSLQIYYKVYCLNFGQYNHVSTNCNQPNIDQTENLRKD